MMHVFKLLFLHAVCVNMYMAFIEYWLQFDHTLYFHPTVLGWIWTWQWRS
jgi:hypothetical protein